LTGFASRRVGILLIMIVRLRHCDTKPAYKADLNSCCKGKLIWPQCQWGRQVQPRLGWVEVKNCVQNFHGNRHTGTGPRNRKWRNYPKIRPGHANSQRRTGKEEILGAAGTIRLNKFVKGIFVQRGEKMMSQS